MSTHLNAEQLAHLASKLAAARKEIARAQQLYDALQMKSGKTPVILSLTLTNERGGDRVPYEFGLVDVEYLSPSPSVRRGREQVLSHLQQFARNHLVGCKSAAEGIEFQIRQLAKGGAA